MYARYNRVILIALLIALTAVASTAKLSLFGVTPSSDSGEYVKTAMYFAGENDSPPPHRLLKPLCTLLVALIGPIVGYENALVAQSILFYALMLVVLYMLAREFTGQTRLAVVAVLLSGLSYPILKYGIEVYVETGALFFYVLSLLLTLRFMRAPSARLYLLNVVVVTAGSLWKEYAVVAGAVLGIAMLAHPVLTFKLKAMYAAAFAGIFLSVQALWQWFVYVHFHFGYSYLLQTSSAGIQNGEFTLRNIAKSTAALIGLAWILVPIGLRRVFTLELNDRIFMIIAAVMPLAGYLWGYVSSRLLYVIAIPYILIALLTLRNWSTRNIAIFTASVLIANIAWLFLSYRITL